MDGSVQNIDLKCSTEDPRGNQAGGAVSRRSGQLAAGWKWGWAEEERGTCRAPYEDGTIVGYEQTDHTGTWKRALWSGSQRHHRQNSRAPSSRSRVV